MVVRQRVRLNEVKESFHALSEKYLLDVRDIEMIFIEALVMQYGSEDVELVNEGIAVKREGKVCYYNIRSQIFREVMGYFERECNRRGAKKISDYVETLLAKNNYILYGSVTYRDAYGYEVQPMLSKDEALRHIDPIYIERVDGASIPEYIQTLPIEIRPRTKQYDADSNTLKYKANYMSKNLCKVHLERQISVLKEKYGIYVSLKPMHYKNGHFYVKDISTQKEMHFKIVNHFVNYFKQFSVKIIIKTTMIRTAKG